MSISPQHPQEGENQSYNDYYNNVKFHFNMLTLIDDHRVEYDEQCIQDCFIYHLQYTNQIMDWIKHECSSLHDVDKHFYTTCLFIQKFLTIVGLKLQMEWFL